MIRTAIVLGSIGIAHAGRCEPNKIGDSICDEVQYHKCHTLNATTCGTLTHTRAGTTRYDCCAYYDDAPTPAEETGECVLDVSECDMGASSMEKFIQSSPYMSPNDILFTSLTDNGDGSYTFCNDNPDSPCVGEAACLYAQPQSVSGYTGGGSGYGDATGCLTWHAGVDPVSCSEYANKDPCEDAQCHWDGDADPACSDIVDGCTDSAYAEYDPSANTDDGSCVTLVQPAEPVQPADPPADDSESGSESGSESPECAAAQTASDYQAAGCCSC